ncbi:MAG TPA: alkaline phosphatase PhoX [Polyangiaceae bacterium]|nr:alkaline phosphatase PhoX [Polyangiaceae bacterium]
MKPIRRRTLLGLSGAAAVAIAAPLPALFARGKPRGSSLVSDPRRLLDLRAGFTYRILDRAGDAMSDGYRVPWRPDGMGCFSGPNGTWILMRNHELTRSEQHGPRGSAPHAYDPGAYGSVTRLVLDAKTRELRSSNLVLTGTLRNCAGGISPWGWLSCEESVDRGHGYVFACRIEADRLEPPKRIATFGRFNHEAACVDPATLATYMTEDRHDGCFYRFLPRDRQHPFEGQLQALRVQGAPNYDVSRLRAGDRTSISWVTIPDADPEDDTVRLQAQERGAAIVRRGEGAWFHEGSVYVCATVGGAEEKGQILRLSPEPENRVASIAEGKSDGIDMPDNITVAPWGDVYMAEDGSGDQFIRALSRSGRVFEVARNARSGGEFAGVCFSPDGTVLFANLQLEGLTVAITGPFEAISASG